MPYSCSIMWRITSFLLVAVLTATISGQSKSASGGDEACVAALSSFSVDPNLTPAPQLPNDLKRITLEYFSSGCYGRCPAFTLRLEENRAIWEGHAFVKKKGKSGTEDFGSVVCEVSAHVARRKHVRYARRLLPPHLSRWNLDYRYRWPRDFDSPASALIFEESLRVLHNNRR